MSDIERFLPSLKERWPDLEYAFGDALRRPARWMVWRDGDLWVARPNYHGRDVMMRRPSLLEAVAAADGARLVEPDTVKPTDVGAILRAIDGNEIGVREMATRALARMLSDHGQAELARSVWAEAEWMAQVQKEGVAK